MLVALDGQQVTGVELGGQGLRPRIGRLGVPRDAHDKDGCRTGGVDLRRFGIRRDAPAVAVGVDSRGAGSEPAQERVRRVVRRREAGIACGRRVGGAGVV